MRIVVKHWTIAVARLDASRNPMYIVFQIAVTIAVADLPYLALTLFTWRKSYLQVDISVKLLEFALANEEDGQTNSHASN